MRWPFAAALAAVGFVIGALGEGISGGLRLAVAVLLYLLPSVIAASRKHRNREAIAALNLLLGWTGLGWVAALIWALTVPRDAL